MLHFALIVRACAGNAVHKAVVVQLDGSTLELHEMWAYLWLLVEVCSGRKRPPRVHTCALADAAVAGCTVLASEADLVRECAALGLGSGGGATFASASSAAAAASLAVSPPPSPQRAVAAAAAAEGNDARRKRHRTRRRRVAISSRLWSHKSVALQCLVLHHLARCDDVYFVGASADGSLRMWLAS